MFFSFFKSIQGQYMDQKKEKKILSWLKSKIQIFIYIYIKLVKVLKKRIVWKTYEKRRKYVRSRQMFRYIEEKGDLTKYCT